MGVHQAGRHQVSPGVQDLGVRRSGRGPLPCLGDDAVLRQDPGVLCHLDGPLGLPAPGGTAQGGGQDADVLDEKFLHASSAFFTSSSSARYGRVMWS